MLSKYHLNKMELEIANSTLGGASNPIQYLGDAYLLESRIIHINAPSIFNFSEPLLNWLYQNKLLYLYGDYLNISSKRPVTISIETDPFLIVKLSERNLGLLERMHEVGNTNVALHQVFLHRSTYSYLVSNIVDLKRGNS
jgi:hypothetical protein